METMSEPTEKKSKAIDNYQDFEAAMKHAQMEEIDELEVTKKFFDKFTKGSVHGTNFTHGKPGVRIFIEGTRDEAIALESMDAEAQRDHVIRDVQAKKKRI